MQWGALTEGKKKNELAQTEFRFIKTIIVIIKGGNYMLVFAPISALLAIDLLGRHKCLAIVAIIFCFG